MAQKIFRPVRGIEPVALSEVEQVADLLLPVLDAAPQVVRNDAHLGNVRHDPIRAIVRACSSAFGLRVLAVLAPVPDHPSDIALVVQDAGTTADMATDRGIAPFASARTGDAFSVEELCNVTR